MLFHSGQLFDYGAAPSPVSPTLRFVATANRLAVLPVVGEVQVTPSRFQTRIGRRILASPEQRFFDSAPMGWSF